VVALQEVDRELARTGGVDQVAALARRTGLHGIFVPALLGDPGTSWRVVGDDDPGGPAYGIGLLTRRGPLRWRRVALPGGGDGRRPPTADGASSRNPGWDSEPRAGVVADLEVGATVLSVLTTHLSYLPWRGIAQLRAALAAAGSGPAVLLGDLNLPVWAVRAASPGWRHAGGRPTYPSWRPRVQPDQLLVRGAVEVGDVEVGPPGTSDHLPLSATLRVGAAGADT